MAPAPLTFLKRLPLALLIASSLHAQAPTPPPSTRTFHDPRYHLSFNVPAGWTLSTRDGDVSTFHLDARTAPRTARMRAVASIASNPYPLSTFSGAFLYFSVTPAATDASCARQVPHVTSTKEIAHQTFTRGHAEQASRICTESRDDIYAAYRNHACYRFDLVVNTFCRQVSGANDITPAELDDIHKQMENILSTVIF